MGVVTRDPALRVDTLADLQGMRVGAVTGTMAGSALVLYRNGILMKGLVTLSQREDLLAALEAGRFDATLTPLGRYDAYRIAHPDTKIVRAAFVHPLRINLGVVSRERACAIAAGNGAIERALAAASSRAGPGSGRDVDPTRAARRSAGVHDRQPAGRLTRAAGISRRCPPNSRPCQGPAPPS
jgi:hypothetical protein